MKTVKVIPASSKPMTLSKAAKILSQFASIENGASPAISAYLKRASAAFYELNQLHKDIRNPHSVRKYKRNKSDNGDCEKDVVENESIQFGDKQGNHRKLIKEEEYQFQRVYMSGKGHNPSLATNLVTEDGIENHKEKKKKRKPDFEAKNSGDHGDDIRDQDEVKPALNDELNQESDHKVENDKVRECAEEKHKNERRKKKKDKASKDIIDASGKVQSIRVKDEMEIEDVNEKGMKHEKSGIDAQRGSGKYRELQIGKIHENKGVEKTVKTEGMEGVEKKKRKKDDVEDRQEDGSRELHSKKRRRKKSKDDI